MAGNEGKYGLNVGVIADGLDSAVKATVFDYSNSNPVAVRLTDTNGDYVSSGGGTEYTEDAAAPSDPVGKAIMLTRDDQLSTVTEAEGDWSRARGTSKGAMWVAIADSSGDPITSFGGGVQYTEGDVDTTITGTALMWEDSSDTLRAVSSVNPLPVTVISSALPSGAATSAKQDTIIGHVDGIETLLGTIDADTGNISTKIDTLAGAVAGTEMQVDVLTMPTVTVQATNLDIRDIDKASDDILVYANTVKDGSGTSYVPLVDADGHLQVDVLTGGGGGTQYTEGDTDASITGTASLMEGAANTLVPLQGTATDGLLVNLGANNDVVVSGSVTANAGTNLNTSLLALESGGNLDLITSNTGDLVTLTEVKALEDDPSGTGHAGVKMLVTRRDTPANTSDTDGDYEFLQMSAGRLWTSTTVTGAVAVTDNSGSLTVDAPVGTPVFVRLSDGASAISTLPVSLASVPSHAVTNAGTFVVQENGAALTSLQLIDDVIFTDDAAFTPASSKVAMFGAEFDDTTPDSVDEGDAGALRMSANRNLYVRIRDNAGNERGLNIDANGALAATVTNASAANLNMTEASAASILTSVQLIDDVIYTDDTSTHTPASTKVAGIGAVAAPTDTTLNANDIGMPGMSVGRELYGVIRDAAGNLRGANVNASNQLTVSVDNTVTVGSHAVTNAGTFAVQVDGSALTALQLIDDPVFADDAAFTVGTSKVMMAGHQAVVMGSNPDAADANDAVAGITNRHRVPYMIGGHPNIINKHIQVTDADGAQTDAALITISTGSKIVVTRYSVTVDSATTATGGVAVRMGFGTASTPSNDANSGMLMAHSGIPAGGGIAEGDGSGIIGMGADNEDLRLTCEDPAGGNIDIVVSYYTIES